MAGKRADCPRGVQTAFGEGGNSKEKKRGGGGIGKGIDRNLALLIPLSISIMDLIPYRFSNQFSLS